MYGRKWTPSKKQAREFAQKMREVEDFCWEHGITMSQNRNSFYFQIGPVHYRVSNHSVEASNRNSLGRYHTNGREKNTIYIHAGKTRIIQIYNDLMDGKKLDGFGNVKGE